jgi:hypothetical protein
MARLLIALALGASALTQDEAQCIAKFNGGQTIVRVGDSNTRYESLGPGYWGPSQGWRATLRSRPRRPPSLSLREPRDLPRLAFCRRGHADLPASVL